MSESDKTYGSEYHLGRYRSDAPRKLDRSILRAVGAPRGSTIAWMYPGPETLREPQGLSFVDDRELRDSWRTVWPTSGRQQSWDGVATLVVPGKRSTWLLIEAKANHPEFCTPPTRATGDGRKQIQRTLNRVKRALGVHRDISWLGSYYQHANRLAVLWFLHENSEPAMFLDLLFTGDRFPDGRRCPSTKAVWHELLHGRRLTLGLPKRHRLSPYVHEAFLPVLGRSE